MSDSEIIWKFLIREFQDDHPAIYMYVCGNIRSPKTAINKILNQTKPIFYPPINEQLITSTIKGFLDRKKIQYINGEIKVKPLY
jgi:hypothetical protein